MNCHKWSKRLHLWGHSISVLGNLPCLADISFAEFTWNWKALLETIAEAFLFPTDTLSPSGIYSPLRLSVSTYIPGNYQPVHRTFQTLLVQCKPELLLPRFYLRVLSAPLPLLRPHLEVQPHAFRHTSFPAYADHTLLHYYNFLKYHCAAIVEHVGL